MIIYIHQVSLVIPGMAEPTEKRGIVDTGKEREVVSKLEGACYGKEDKGGEKPDKVFSERKKRVILSNYSDAP